MNPSFTFNEKFRIAGQSLIWMVAGSSLMIASILWLNKFIEPARRSNGVHVSRFTTEILPPTVKKERSTTTMLARTRAKQMQSSTSVSQALRPSVSGNVGGTDFGFGSFTEVDSDNASFSSNATSAATLNQVTLTSDSVDRPPVPVRQIAPEYPKEARNKGLTGIVVANLRIDAQGNVVEINITDSQPVGIFDSAAKNALLAWKFTPAFNKGVPAEVWVRQSVRFDLN